MDSILSHALTFVGGVLAKWVQSQLQDRKKDWNDLKEGTLRPIRIQIHNAIPQMEHSVRVTSVDLELWGKLVAAGKDREIPENLRPIIRELYTTHFPTLDKARMAVDGAVEEVMRLADTELGGVPAGTVPLPAWWQFLLSETFEPSLIAWSEGGPPRLWNKLINPMRYMAPPANRVDLLKRIWIEGQHRDMIKDYRAHRGRCLALAKDCLRSLDAALEGGIPTRASKKLRELLP
jgi:hypothetical protein